jgi:hypothetical protein
VIALTRIGANSSARFRANASIAPSTAASVDISSMGFRLTQPENKEIDPPGPMCGAAYFTQWCCPPEFGFEQCAGALSVEIDDTTTQASCCSGNEMIYSFESGETIPYHSLVRHVDLNRRRR